MKNIISDLINKKDLTKEQCFNLMEQILNGKCSDSEMAAFMVLLREKGETAIELSSLVNTMWNNMPEFGTVDNTDTIDTCGTGGSQFKTFNISTGVSFILSALDVKVAKHGNRAASSTSGAADVLEELGYNLDLEPKKVAELFNETDFAFLSATIFHPGMRYAKNVRTDLGVRTTFNFLGPLANPFRAPIRFHGVSDRSMVDRYIKTLDTLKVERAIVFCSQNSMDEISISGITRGKRIDYGEVNDFEFNPAEFGFSLLDDSDIVGKDPKYNAEILKRVFWGENSKQREIIVANAMIGYGLVKNIELSQAKLEIEYALDNGIVHKKFSQIIDRSNSI